MSDISETPEWGEEEYEVRDSEDVSDEELAEQEEPAEVDIVELLNFMRIYLLQLNARVTTIEDFLTQFVEEVEKAAGSGEDEPPKPELHVVS